MFFLYFPLFIVCLLWLSTPKHQLYKFSWLRFFCSLIHCFFLLVSSSVSFKVSSSSVSFKVSSSSIIEIDHKVEVISEGLYYNTVSKTFLKTFLRKELLLYKLPLEHYPRIRHLILRIPEGN